MKNIFKVLAILPVMFLLFIINSGCKKSIDNKIVGTWSVVHVDDMGNKNIDEWIFTNNYEIYFNQLPYGGVLTHQDTGQYITNTSMGKKYVEIVQCKIQDNNKKYRIMKLNKKVMKLIIESKTGLSFIEFTKVAD
jgi:hypothetical protein